MQRITQEEPWAKIPHWVVMCPELDASAIRVYAVLSKHANRSRQSFPGLVKLAAEGCMSKTTVVRALAQLETVGAVEVHRERASNNRHKVNLYHLPLARGSTEIGLPPGSTVVPPSAVTEPPSSAETGQELDLKNQVTRETHFSIPKQKPGESMADYLARIHSLMNPS